MEFEASAKPTSSPWGQPQHTEELAPGIWSVSTAGHGGIKLSCQRNRAMPEYARIKGGWYEEDCDWALVALVFPEPFQVLRPWQKEGASTYYEVALNTVKNWRPGAYEAHFDVKLTEADSYWLREKGVRAYVEPHVHPTVAESITAELLRE